MSEKWLVYSREHNMWWRPERRGYAANIEDAGRYTKAEAESCCDTRGSGVFGGPSEFMVMAPEAEARLAEAERLINAVSLRAKGSSVMACDIRRMVRAFLDQPK